MPLVNSSGWKENPTYEDVTSGSTGHAEAVMVKFNPSIISFEALLEVSFATHDPTKLNKQWNDVGSEYRSIILYNSNLQKEIAQEFSRKLEQENAFQNSIVTELKKFTKFYEAEDYHHDYFAKNPNAPYCQVMISPKVAKLKKNLQKYLVNTET